jgi:hypothetical protein
MTGGTQQEHVSINARSMPKIISATIKPSSPSKSHQNHLPCTRKAQTRTITKQPDLSITKQQ